VALRVPLADSEEGGSVILVSSLTLHDVPLEDVGYVLEALRKMGFEVKITLIHGRTEEEGEA
jgi:hypothetical protein